MYVDSGSSDTWLVATGAQCHNEAGELTSDCDFGPIWDVAGCSAPIPDVNFYIAYGGVNVDEGTFCTIDVTLGGIT